MIVISTIWLLPILIGIGAAFQTDGIRRVVKAGLLGSIVYTLPYAILAGCTGVTAALGCIRICSYDAQRARRLLAFAAGARAFPAAIVVVLWLSVLRALDWSDWRWIVAFVEGLLLAPLALIVLVPRHIDVHAELLSMARADGLAPGLFFRRVELRSLARHITTAMLLLIMTAWGSEVFVVRALSGTQGLPLARFLGRYIHPYQIEWSEVRAAGGCAAIVAVGLVGLCYAIARPRKQGGVK